MGNCICFRNTLIYVICWDQVLLFITLLWFLERFYSLANGWTTDQPKAVVDQTLSNIVKHQTCNDMEQKNIELLEQAYHMWHTVAWFENVLNCWLLKSCGPMFWKLLVWNWKCSSFKPSLLGVQWTWRCPRSLWTTCAIASKHWVLLRCTEKWNSACLECRWDLSTIMFGYWIFPLSKMFSLWVIILNAPSQVLMFAVLLLLWTDIPSQAWQERVLACCGPTRKTLWIMGLKHSNMDTDVQTHRCIQKKKTVGRRTLHDSSLWKCLLDKGKLRECFAMQTLNLLGWIWTTCRLPRTMKTQWICCQTVGWRPWEWIIMNFIGDIIGDFFLGTSLYRSSLCANIFLNIHVRTMQSWFSGSIFLPRTAMSCMLNGDAVNGWLNHFGLKCSTWTSMNCGTSSRSACSSIGNTDFQSVREGNCLGSRIFEWIIGWSCESLISLVLTLINPISLASKDYIIDDDSSLYECLHCIGATKPKLLRILPSVQGLHPMSYLQWRGWSSVLFLNQQTIPPSATKDALPNPIWIIARDHGVF